MESGEEEVGATSVAAAAGAATEEEEATGFFEDDEGDEGVNGVDFRELAAAQLVVVEAPRAGLPRVEFSFVPLFPTIKRFFIGIVIAASEETLNERNWGEDWSEIRLQR
jgi:hypothetical protein